MAGATDSIDKMPVWQRVAAFVLIAVLIAVGWYVLFWTEATKTHEDAETAVAAANKKLEDLKVRKENFVQEQRDHEKRETEFNAKMEVLPMSSSTIDNLMQTFQQQANIGGFSVESWTPESEEKQDFYARLPIAVKAKGTWGQTAEFFRKVSELKQIVSVENIALKAKRKDADPGGHPILDVEFEVATYRFLSDAERADGAAASSRGSKRKRKGAK